MSNIRVRIAPSPTGPLHVGTARTALFNYLFARHHDGKFILRIEDTDLERSDKKYEEDIFEGLRWLGIEADESPECSGPHGPYRQSERIKIYKKYIQKLLDERRAFYCFHSKKELEEEKEKLLAAKHPPIHLCEYRTLDPAEAAMFTQAKSDYIIRFKTPSGRKIEFQDLIRGDVSFDSDLLGDFSIAKRVDVPLYNFAVIIDDETMEISHVIRGEDHISNTPKQLLLIEALGFKIPQYAHLPLILGSDRSKLSKRHGPASVNEYRAAGYLPEALFNFLALLGWNSGNDREFFSKKELIKEFSLEKVQKSGAIFDITKLDWMNGEYIRKKSAKELLELCQPFLADFLQNQNSKIKIQNDYLEKIIKLEQPRLKKLAEIGERTEYFFWAPEYDKELLCWKNMSDTELIASLEAAEKIISNFQTPISKEKIEEAFLKEIGEGDKGRILWPLRVALTGKKASPGPFEIMEILGIEESLRRIAAAKQKKM
ncbi:MAG: Glutamate-tRNA ligase [Parcubacteria group bacterium GW2011_GWA2_45_30]|nr:MAG: Glutamate-tRNA ligase [Parcubacteria group bacterium GW2011_GWA2_45_30]